MAANVFKRTFVDFLLEFIQDSRSIGIVLLACTFISLVVSNIPGGENYLNFWQLDLHFFDQFHLPHSLLHWINDGLMAVFFLLVGMEIKHEVLEGELSSLKKSMLPIAGALGGMVFPAVIFFLFNAGTPFSKGWGIPMATDIAFALGIASLLGKKVPLQLKIFLTALAIIDDLGAILVIAVFYGGAFKIIFLIACVLISLLLLFLNKRKVPFGIVYYVLGLLLWYCMYNSGIHATVAGVLFAVTVPVKNLNEFQHKLHNPVYFFIMPIFALSNTAIIFPSGGIGVLNGSLPWGIMLGLLIGKPVGIVLAAWLMVKSNLADLPLNTSWRKMIGAGILAAIGFTMSIFIATLAFDNKEQQDTSKIAVLVASFAAMVAGYGWLYTGKKTEDAEVMQEQKFSHTSTGETQKRF